MGAKPCCALQQNDAIPQWAFHTCTAPAETTGPISDDELEALPEIAPPKEVEADQIIVPPKITPRPRPWQQRPLKVTIVSARGLRNADWGWGNKSDPYCICTIPSKPLSKFVTHVIDDNLNPVWNYEGIFGDYAFGDSLFFTVWDSDFGKSDDFLGRTALASSEFHPSGFDGELRLAEAGRGIEAYLRIRVEEAVREPEPELECDQMSREQLSNNMNRASVSSLSSLQSFDSTGTQSNVPRKRPKKAPPSGNQNKPSDYAWLETTLRSLDENKADTLGCVDVATGVKFSPIFFVIGACPNALCGMQAIGLFVDADLHLDFWWVKPQKGDLTKIEKKTLSRQSKGTHKNDPGRSKPFYQPLADLFQSGALVKDWRFGLERVTTESGAATTRAFVKREKPADAVVGPLYIHLLWQEDWSSNPFARSKYIKGKIVYRKEIGSTEFYSRQYEIVDGEAFIAELEEDPWTTVLPPESVKGLFQLRRR